MELTVTINPETAPNAVGELLRAQFFGVSSEEGLGCYTHFEWAKDVKPLPNEVVDEDDEFPMSWKRGMLDDIECRWYWDGDGTLEFLFSDGSVLYNTDCKKDYRWEYISGE